MDRKCILEGTCTPANDNEGTIKVLLACQRRGPFTVLIHESSPCLILDPDENKPRTPPKDDQPIGDMQIDKDSSLEEYQTYARLHQIDYDGRWRLDAMRKHLCRNFTKFR